MHMSIYVYVCICIYMCVYAYVYTCVYICEHTVHGKIFQSIDDAHF